MASSNAELATSNGRVVEYMLSAGSPEAPVVLLASSLAMDFTSWDHVAEVLQKAGFRTLGFNQPGHGRSGVPSDLSSLTMEDLADNVHGLLGAVGVPRLHAWIGVSLGSMVGMYFVAKYPGVVRKLVIGDTFPCSPVNTGKPDTFGPMVELSRADGGMAKIIAATTGRWLGAEWLAAHPADADRVRRSMVTTAGAGFEVCTNALRSPTFDARPLLGKIAASVEDVLMVVGEKDADLPVVMEGMRAAIEEGSRAQGKGPVELKVVPGAGHISFVDGFDDYCGFVTPFLK